MSWRPVLSGADAERARAVALEVASRLAALEPSAAERAMAGLSTPDSSIALVCAELDRLSPDSGWDRAGHEHLSATARAAERDGTPVGLFDGVAGIGYAAQRLAAGRPRYGNLLTAIDEAIATTVAASRPALAAMDGMPVRAWDLISGLTGIGVYLLARRDEPGPRAALDDTLAALVDLMGDANGAPRWATPPEHLFEDMRTSAPEGNLNCGLAHGVLGPLALMALASREGVAVSGQAEAMQRMADWVTAQSQPGRFGPEWPAAIPLGEAQTAELPPARPGWCYGNAGVGRALWLAGMALDEPELGRLAERAVRTALARQQSEQPLKAPTLCHGTAGLAQVTLRMAADTGAEDLERAARELCLEVLDRFDTEAPLGYRGEAELRDLRGAEVDSPVLLDGAAGPALVLLAAATDADPAWDRALLLS
jgi:lantibiotic biosynthesis protein